MIRDGVTLIVITLDGDDRDASFLQQLKTGNRMVHRLRIDVAAVKEITRDEHEINFVRESVIGNHVIPCPEKVFRALFQIIAATAQMYVCKMEESHMTNIIRQKRQEAEDSKAEVRNDALRNFLSFLEAINRLDSLQNEPRQGALGVLYQRIRVSSRTGSPGLFRLDIYPKIWILICVFG